MKFPLIPLLMFSTILFTQQSIVFGLTISEPPAPAPSYVAMAPSPEPEPKPDKNVTRIFNVLEFGATGDGVSDDTQAFKMAWDSGCQSESPAVVLAPYGYSFLIQPTIFTGPCNGELVFQIDGTIMPPDGPESWPLNASKRQWLVFYRINGVSFNGGGAIDGRGEKWWDLPCKPHKQKGINGTQVVGPCDSPVALRFYRSSNLTIEGLRVKNSPQFHFRFDNCENIEIKSLNIKAPSSSPNTDGIHVENTNNVRIHNSIISNGDDCVSIGGGCHNVDIKNITCGPSHGISIGSLGNHNSRACVSNITVSDAFIRHSDNGVRIKTWQGGYGSVSKINFNNIHMENVRNPIIIDQYYCLTKNCSNQTSAVNIYDVSYTHIKGTYDVRSPALHLACSDSVPCSSLRLSEIELVPYSPAKFVALPFCWNAYGVMESLVVPPVSCLMQSPPTFLERNVVDQC